jgi:hypothetical protein
MAWTITKSRCAPTSTAHSISADATVWPRAIVYPKTPVKFLMKSFEVKVTAVVKLPTYRIKVKTGHRRKDIILTLWRMSVSYLAMDEAYEIELQEPLKQLACTEYSIGRSGLAEFDFSAAPPVNIGDRIRIDAYRLGERVRED